ncbi:response regulator [Rufibacter latericius]|nr:response regulator [Rufibacter latericius]
MDPTKKVLLVDDDGIYIFLLKRLLKRLGSVGEVVSAKEGSEALAMLRMDAERGTLPQVIITDIQMPGMDGIAFAKELAKLGLVDYRHTKVILNSGKASYANLDWPVEVPSASFFPKPLTYEDLAGILG